jgi:hypothetical protein
MDLMSCPDFTAEQPHGPATLPKYYCSDAPRYGCPLCDGVKIFGPKFPAIAAYVKDDSSSASDNSSIAEGHIPRHFRGMAGNDLRYLRLILKQGHGLRIGKGPAKKDAGLDIPGCQIM